MRKKVLFVMTFAMFSMAYWGIVHKNEVTSDLLLSDVESLALDDEGKTDCKNVTFIPDEALRSAPCWNGATHKKCKKESKVCCNPSEQTDCPPLF